MTIKLKMLSTYFEKVRNKLRCQMADIKGLFAAFSVFYFQNREYRTVFFSFGKTRDVWPIMFENNFQKNYSGIDNAQD